MGKNKEFKKGFLCGALAAVVLIVGLMIPTWAKSSIISKSDVKQKAYLLQKLVDENYLYADDVDTSALENAIYSGYISGLDDPYSQYYDKEAFQELKNNIDGTFYGIGAVFETASNKGYLTLLTTYEGTPANEADLQKGDVVVAVDGVDASTKTTDEVLDLIKGDEGTEVTITFSRNGKEIKKTMKRAKIEVPTVDYTMVDGNIGYIVISEFTGETATQFEDAFTALKEQGMEGLIIDIRNNLGGRLDTTCEILDMLLPEGDLVKTKDKDGNIEVLATSDEENKWEEPIVILVNEYSASASEVFAGAMQDYGAATLVGTQTYGKGVIQQLFSLSDGSGVKLTIAEYFTPNNQVINKNGVTPDVSIELSGDTDNQYNKALQVLKEKMN